MCESLPAPTNGAVTVDLTSGLASYTCDLGYTMDGAATRSCSMDGSSWSHTQPMCGTNP